MEKTVEDRIRDLTTHPDWELVEQRLLGMIQELYLYEPDDSLPSDVLARNVIANIQTRKALESFLLRIGLIKEDKIETKTKMSFK